MGHYDAAHIKELRERIEYELFTLNFVRHRLYRQHEGAEDFWSLKLKDLQANPDSFLLSVTLPAILNPCEEDVREALMQFVPLSFACAFKVNDMIAEWILGTQNIDVPWGFKAKVKLYQDVKGVLNHPQLFHNNPHLELCFWELYSSMSDLRHSVTHRCDFELLPGGALKFTPVGSNPIVMAVSDLASYIRFSCLLVDFLFDDVPRERRSHSEAIFNRDLLQLQNYHKINLPNFRTSRLVEVVIIAHEQSDGSLPSPTRFSIPLVPVWNRLKKDFSPGGQLVVLPLLHVTAEDDNERLVWIIPPEHVPEHVIVLDLSDPEWSRFICN